MSESVKKVNSFFKTAIKHEVSALKMEMLLSDRQELIFDMYYIRRLNVYFIADKLAVSPEVITKELKTIRKKLLKALDL